MHKRYRHFVRIQRKLQKEHGTNDGVYLVKSDIHACFDSIKQELLVDIVDEIMKRIKVKYVVCVCVCVCNPSITQHSSDHSASATTAPTTCYVLMV
jgi:hypothetical protein